MSPDQGLEYRGRRMSRRQAFNVWGSLVLGAAGVAAIQSCLAPQRVERSPAQMQALIQAGARMRSSQDIDAVKTRAGIDIPYSRLYTASDIRGISDPVKRTMAAIGFLDVERNSRYQGIPGGACNIYATDLARLVLGNRAIGSRFNVDNGTPTVAGPDDINWESHAVVQAYGAQNPFLAAWNLDNWMRRHGDNHGWKMVGSPQELEKLLHSGRYIALGVTRKELISAPGQGHSYILTDGEKKGFGLTQATNNISYNWISDRDEKATPGGIYNIHAHEIPGLRAS